MSGTHVIGGAETLDRDAVVVGAGPAGPMAARTLQTADRSVAVLEARGRAGGRTWSRKIGGAFLEVGGQRVPPDQTELLGLLDEPGVSTFPRHRACPDPAAGGHQHVDGAFRQGRRAAEDILGAGSPVG
nr:MULTISPECIES: FAD-dependent oxidoreductase [unclassified Nocardiopsis]